MTNTNDLNKAINDAAREKVLLKIRKLLALARDEGASENEAATAARQAASLMAKYQIDAADTLVKKMDEDTEFAQELAAVNPRKRARPFDKASSWAGILAVGVATLFDCKLDIVGVRNDGVRFRFSGHATDAPVAVWTQEMLMATIYRTSLNAAETAFNRASKTAFRMGAAIRLQQRMEAMVEARNADVQKTGTGTALVLFETKKNAVAKRFGETGKKNVKVKLRPNTVEELAFAAGKAAGDKMNINRALAGEAEKKQIANRKLLN